MQPDNKQPDNKPLSHRLWRKLGKPVYNLLTLRRLRKYLRRRRQLVKLRQIISDLEKDNPQKVVLIFQEQFFDREGQHCYNGGAERYVRDLAQVIAQFDLTPILIQYGKDRLWKRRVNHLSVIGLPADEMSLWQEALKFFRHFELAIYSGVVPWGKELLHPNIMISHGITWDCPQKDADTAKILNDIKKCDCLVSVDTNTISWLRSTFAKTLSKSKMAYVPNYVDLQVYHPKSKKNDGRIKIVFPRRAAKERGYWLMSRALKPILNKYTNVDFAFVGFAHGKEIQSDILKLEAEFGRRVMHFVYEPDEMAQAYQNSDISLVPTLYSEGTSLSVLEAMACGNAVIATNIGGLPNLIIDGFNGVLINPDEQELMQALDKILADDRLRLYLAQNAQEVAKCFAKSNWEERWRKILAANLKGK